MGKNVAVESKTSKKEGKKREVIEISDSEEPRASTSKDVIEVSDSEEPHELRTFFERAGFDMRFRKK